MSQNKQLLHPTKLFAYVSPKGTLQRAQIEVQVHVDSDGVTWHVFLTEQNNYAGASQQRRFSKHKNMPLYDAVVAAILEFDFLCATSYLNSCILRGYWTVNGHSVATQNKRAWYYDMFNRDFIDELVTQNKIKMQQIKKYV